MCRRPPGIAQVHCGAHQNKQQQLGGYPKLCIFGREPRGDLTPLPLKRHTGCHHRDETGKAHPAAEAILQRDKQERNAQQDQHLCAVPQTKAAEHGRQQGTACRTRQNAQHNGERDPRKRARRDTAAVRKPGEGRKKNDNEHIVHRGAGHDICGMPARVPLPSSIRRSILGTITAATPLPRRCP